MSIGQAWNLWAKKDWTFGSLIQLERARERVIAVQTQTRSEFQSEWKDYPEKLITNTELKI